MKKVFIVLFVLWASVGSAAEPAMQKLVDGNTAFAIDAYHNMRHEAGNIVFSPYSISTALAMTYVGARGETETQMAQALHFTLGRSELHQAFGALQAHFRQVQDSSPVRLNIANALWIQKGYELLSEFTAVNKKYYDANLFTLNFKTEPEPSRLKINRWVEKETHDKIKDLLSKGTIKDTTRLVLTNAIYFKATWKHQFEHQNTHETDFWLTPKEKTTVPMMYQKDYFGYGENKTMQVLEMPYRETNLSMFILLPKKNDGLARLESMLSTTTLKEWTSDLGMQEVKVFLPKFRATRDLNLNNLLMALGMVDAFSLLKADFSGIEPKKELLISDVIHKAFIDVDEAGTEAAAATAVVIRAGAAPMTKTIPVFKADHPFLFLICDNQTGSILFMGRLMEPKS